MRFARPLIVALFVLVMAVTPLSAHLSGGVFEIWLAGSRHVTPTRVSLRDTTGLVRGIVPVRSAAEGVSNPNGDPRALLVGWMGGCGDSWTTLTLTSAGMGYRIVQHTDSHCSYMIGISRAVVISLWAPVDAASVQFEAD